ncbi:MAG TPA: hypothetical protein ENI98_01270 [Gammaproteobacteria bacterium]|nr:hypothetical protein [Gammaproteobacteria bacterium]
MINQDAARGDIRETVIDANDNLTGTVDANGVAGLQPVNAQGQTQRREYDEAGNVLLREDRSGRQRRHTYDVLNRLIKTEDTRGQTTVLKKQSKQF